jgi:DNA-binding FrmR family transcriptional regulator
MMNEETKENADARLKRIAGQIAGIQRMVDEDRYCVDVILQISAARAALAKVSKLLLEAHIQTCVRAAFESKKPSERDEKMNELVRLFDKNCNC